MGEASNEQISNGQKYLLLLFMILSGGANTLVYNAQNSSMVVLEENGVLGQYYFVHPFMQALTMFIGEFSVILAFVFTKKLTSTQREIWDKEKQEEADAKGLSLSWIRFIWLIIPASSDFCTSTLQYIALGYINPSIYQMMRGGVILVTALFSKCFLKKTIYKHMILGCGVVFLGIGLVGSSNFIFPESSDNSDAAPGYVQGIAIGLILISLLFNGCLFVSEEFLFGKFLLHPFQVVGTEGFWGILIYCIVLPILSLSHCNLSKLKNTCIVYPIQQTINGIGLDYNSDINNSNSTFESPALYLKQFGNNGQLATFCLLGILTIAAFNVCGVNVTKHINSLTRSIADVSRTLLVWIGSIIITVTAGATNDRFKWENLRWQAIIIEVFGFILLVFGNFIYNGIVVIPNFELPDQKKDSDEEDQLLNKKDISLQQQDFENDNDIQYAKPQQRARKSTAKDSFHN